MPNNRICLVEVGSTKNGFVTDKTDISLESYSFKAE